MSRSLKAHLLLIFITLIWGTTFVLIKAALRDITPLYFNAIRMSLAAGCLLLVFGRKLGNTPRATYGWGVLIGLFLALGYEFQTAGLVLTTASKSAFITGLAVVFVPILMAIGWRRMVQRWTAVGVLLALGGLYLLTSPGGAGGGINRGDLLTLCGAVVFAMQIVLVGRATRVHAFEAIAVVQIIACAGFMWIAVPAIERPHAVWSPLAIFTLVFTAVACTAFAFSVQAWAQQFTPPTHTALIFSTEPVFAGITSFVVLGERLGWRGGAGAVLILSGVLISELLGRSAQAQPEPQHPRESLSAEEA